MIEANKPTPKNIPNDSAVGHVSGSSVYIDDMPFQSNEVLVDYLGSPYARGRVLSLDLADALAVPGVVGLYTYRDLHSNKFGPILQDEILLVEEIAEFIGQPVVVIAALSREAIKIAKQKIQLTMEELTPVLTVDQAIEQELFIDRTYKIERGDVDHAMEQAPHTISGRLTMGGADHFYLESQACLVYPGEYNQLVVHSSTQNPSEVQHEVAHLLGLNLNQVVCITKRMGGGFGGKECQATHPAVMAALVAQKTGRPARFVMSKDDDMMYTGKRHPFQNDYKIAFDDNGLILALDGQLYADGGAYNDLSTAVLGRALTHIDNAYYIPNLRVVGRIAKTNFPPNTAFRGFGGPQGVLTIESIIEEIAAYLKKDALDIRRLNCYGVDERNVTHYGQTLEQNTLPQLFDQLTVSSDYKARRAQIDAFNASSKTHLKGLALTAVKFGISFTNKFLNQANALVNVYQDGTIQVSTGATEMGQGVNTNLKIIVSDEFGIDADQVIVMATSTEKNNNTSATAASSATDLNGSAAQIACRKIKQGMAMVAAKHFGYTQETTDNANIVFANGTVYDAKVPTDKLTFKQLVGMTYRERVSLGERGHYATPSIHFDWNIGQGSPFLYFTNGVAAAEVLVDRFTGELKVARVDILMDIGKSLNPGINRGQIIGAFFQGMGWLTLEDLRYSTKGVLLSHSPTTYKVPGVYDLPRVFNVDVIDNDNTVNVRGTKAVGEPPLLLGISVWAAVKNALSYVSGSRLPALNTPASGEEILYRLTMFEEAPSKDPLWGEGGMVLIRGVSYAHGVSKSGNSPAFSSGDAAVSMMHNQDS
jgi:xanthine dehydrogenase large subunit